MSRYQDHNRTRNKTVSFRLTPEEYRQMEERIKITGLLKNEFMIRSMLEQHISIQVGKFESDRLSLEVRRLKAFGEQNGVCVLLVHHSRKQPAGDSLQIAGMC